jgi:hypothetical protein
MPPTSIPTSCCGSKNIGGLSSTSLRHPLPGLNSIEGFFAKLTKKRLKRGVLRSLRKLKDAIHRFLDDANANPKPFT